MQLRVISNYLINFTFSGSVTSHSPSSLYKSLQNGLNHLCYVCVGLCCKKKKNPVTLLELSFISYTRDVTQPLIIFQISRCLNHLCATFMLICAIKRNICATSLFVTHVLYRQAQMFLLTVQTCTNDCDHFGVICTMRTSHFNNVKM